VVGSFAFVLCEETFVAKFHFLNKFLFGLYVCLFFNTSFCFHFNYKKKTNSFIFSS